MSQFVCPDGAGGSNDHLQKYMYITQYYNIDKLQISLKNLNHQPFIDYIC